MVFLLFSLELALVSDSATAKFFSLGVEHFFVNTVFGHTDNIVIVLNRLEVTYADDFTAVISNSAERNDAVLVVIKCNPLETVPIIVVLMHGRNITIELVCLSKEKVKLTVLFK